MPDDPAPPDLLALLAGCQVERLVLTCRPDTAGGWRGEDPHPRLDVEFVWNGGCFARLRGAAWFPVDEFARLGAALDAVCRHNEREDGDR